MKIQFRSRKAENPAQDRGVKVLYGPARRTGYRLRWYLILVLVAIPIGYLAYSLGSMVFISELSGQVELKRQVVRAPVNGRIAQVDTETGQEVEAGDLLVRLRDPALERRIGEIEAEAAALAEAIARRREGLNLVEGMWDREVAELDRQLEGLTALRREGAITAAEVRAVRTQLAAGERQRSQALADGRAAILSLETRRAGLLGEREGLAAEAGLLQLRASVPARVSELATAAGEDVIRGDALLTLMRRDQYRLLLYLPPRHGHRLAEGAALDIVFPDSSRYGATVVGRPLRSQRPPAELVGPLSANRRALEVALRLNKPLAPAHAVDGLSFKAEVPSVLPWLR